MKRTIVLALVLVMAAAGMAAAQTLTGTISGKVVDQQGAVLPGVTVTLTGKTGVKTTVSDARGEFRFVGLTPGTYDVKSELQGFRSASQSNLDVSMGKSVDVNLSMGVGGMTEVVEVVANAMTIDPTTTATDTNMAQSLLFSMPITHNNPAVSLLNYSPGVNDSSAFGGSASSGNSLMLDGVDTRDPEAGTAWTFYNYNIIDEVQVGSLGQPAEYGGFTGAIINTITKSGGNRFSLLAEYRYSTEGLGSKNATAAMIALNKNLASPTTVLTLKDYTVQLGGPLKKDKMFFFLSAQRYEISQTFTGLVRGEISPRFNGKLTWQPTSSDTITGSLQYDQYNQTGRTAFIPSYAITNHSQTIDQDSPEYIWNAQWRKVFGSSTFLEAKFLGYWGYYDLNPVSNAAAHYDAGTGAYSGGAGYWYQADRTRNQLNVSLSKYVGSHSFKFGAEIERSNVRNRFAYSPLGAGLPTGYFVDYYGAPSYAYGYTYDIKGKNKRDTFYAQDAWKVGRGLTLNFGVRGDRIRGESTTEKKDLYSTMSYGPRLGAAIDLSGKGTSVVRAFYGQMYDGAIFASWGRAVPGLTDFITYTVGPNWKSVKEDSRVPATLKYKVGDNLKHPRVDEVNVSWDQQIGRAFKFTATGIYRNWKNFINSMLIGGTWTPNTFNSTFTNQSPVIGPTQLQLFKWGNKGVVPQQFLIQNTDNVDYNLTNGSVLHAAGTRQYKGIMLQFQRALRDRWQAQISYVLSSTTGTIRNSSTSGVSSGQFETPNTIVVNAGGPTDYDRRHEVKIFAGYQIPKAEISVNAYFRYLSGWPYSPYVRVGTGTTAWSSTLNINLVERGYFVTPNSTNLDLRFEKVFDIGLHRFGIYADISNTLNRAYMTSPQTRYPNISLTDLKGKSFTVKFGDPTAINAGRQITLGGRWSF